jgi:hypothetical protein
MTEDVYSDLTVEQFTPTANDLSSIMGPAYSSLRTVYFGWHGYFDLMEECSDEIATVSRPRGWFDGGVYQNMHEHTWTPLQSHINSLWTRCFQGITHSNRGIYQIETGEIPLSEDLSKAYISELRVARAFYYYILCDAFGNIPVTTKYNIEQGELPEQKSRDEVFNFIITEITESLPYLSETVSPETYARWNKWAAKVLLAKMYLNAEIYTGTAKWAECITQCNDLINSGKYQLEDNFRNCFITENQNSVELIFTIPFDNIYATEFQTHLKTLPSTCQSVYDFKLPPWGYGGSCGIPQFIDTYEQDDSRLDDCWIKGFMISRSGDTIRSMLDFVTPLQFKNELRGDLDCGEMEGYRLGKYEFEIGCSYLSNDYVIFRYADVLMMKAECLMRTGLINEAAELVTTVRERNFKSNPAKAIVNGNELTGGSLYNYGFVKEGVLVEIEGGADVVYGRFLDELGWEFCQEARRRQDQIRFGVFTTKKWLSHQPNGAYRSIFPIPDAELNKNPNLSQNQGY